MRGLPDFPFRSIGSRMVLNVGMSTLAMLFVYIWIVVGTVHASCSALNDCSGHGICGLNSRCNCFEGWGAKSDITSYRSPDCSTRVCPSGKSWGDLPRRDGSAHNLAECSDKGKCDRVTGKCICAQGYEGSACQRMKCPNNCSGHGVCMTMERLASRLDAFPLTDMSSSYESSNSSIAWDSSMVTGCLCESSWPVGLKVNQTQQSEWFGPDCSMRHCPSADDPRTVLDETDCSNATNTAIPGEAGNKCHVDCANQGVCDFRTGTCQCFPGQYGLDCSIQLEVPASMYFHPDGIYGTTGDADADVATMDLTDLGEGDWAAMGEVEL